jgi:hypothetical protein
LEVTFLEMIGLRQTYRTSPPGVQNALPNARPPRFREKIRVQKQEGRPQAAFAVVDWDGLS